ncbi:hypothetical protein [Streptomyces sp. NBC_00996]|uniref:hypothetical protein n=1 Tax=Streptomyces sp. NBC_00996 TaxID=2903710 RepID=UPI00386941BE|nr:hypothetical protein OG390_21840 [Streptomyces sp. NBC_00996]
MTEDADGSLLDLPAEVAERVVAELSDRGRKAVAALRTAAVLIAQAVHDETGLRFAESAAYNLREALEAVVTGRTPVPGGLPAVIEAWKQFERERAQPGNDDTASLEMFGTVVRSAAERQDRNSYHEAKLLGYFRDKSGVDPLFGGLDPVVEYKRLRRTASQGLHRETALDSVTELYQRTLAWFVRMFTPPDTVVLALRELAAETWRGLGQIDRLRELASNPHHLRMFFASLVDSAWLAPLYQAGVVPVPDGEGPWPVVGLLDGLGRTKPAEVAGLAQQLLADCKRLPVKQRLEARFKLLILATQLGPNGHTIVGDVTTAHPDNGSVRSLAASVVKRADPTAPIVERVGNVVLNGGPQDHDSYYYRLLLDQLVSGMTPNNAEKRTRMVAAKLRHDAQEPAADWFVPDIARLTSDLGEDDRYFLVVVSHYLARILVRAHALGVPSRRLLDWFTEIPGEVGERLTCRVLALADDIPVQDKIEHVTRRLASQRATGDDQDLVDAVLAANPDPAQLAVWTDALGSPSDPPADPALLPQDWARAWRWSAILPGYLLTRWQDPIASVSARHGQIGPEAFGRRIPTSYATWGQSAYSMEELAALPALDAARLVAGWRPDADSDRRMIGARELARVLQSVVAAEPQKWTADAVMMVETLREPVYVLHYLDALAGRAADILPRTGEIITAARLAMTERWTPTVLGNDNFDFEPDWHRVETANVELITALADHEAPFAEHLDTAWSWALAALESPPGTDISTMGDPLHRAINAPRGRGLQAVLSLAHWEHRNMRAIRPQFLDTLDNLVHVDGPVGMEYRAILASQRPRLELIAQDWLDRRVDTLFRADDIGLATVDLTLKYARYTTPWLHRTLRDDIIAAALRGTDNAVASLLIGTLEGAPGYDIDAIITALREEPAVLSRAAEDMALLVQDSPADAPQLALAVQFWQALTDASRDVVPVEVLRRTGRWAFVTGLPDSIWSPLTVRTLIITEGLIDYAIEVADRCKTVSMPGDSTRILLLLQGRGEPWEQHHIGRVALSALRTLSTGRPDEHFPALRTRLIELGYDEAADLNPAVIRRPSAR